MKNHDDKTTRWIQYEPRILPIKIVYCPNLSDVYKTDTYYRSIDISLGLGILHFRFRRKTKPKLLNLNIYGFSIDKSLFILTWGYNKNTPRFRSYKMIGSQAWFRTTVFDVHNQPYNKTFYNIKAEQKNKSILKDYNGCPQQLDVINLVVSNPKLFKTKYTFKYKGGKDVQSKYYIIEQAWRPVGFRWTKTFEKTERFVVVEFNEKLGRGIGLRKIKSTGKTSIYICRQRMKPDEDVKETLKRMENTRYF